MKKIILLIFLSFYGFVQAQTWNEQLVNPGSVVGPESMSYDHLGNPIAVYDENTIIMYSYWNGSSWTSKQIYDPYRINQLGLLRVDTLIYIYAAYALTSNSTQSSIRIWEIDRFGNIKNNSYAGDSGYQSCSACYDNQNAKIYIVGNKGYSTTLKMVGYNLLNQTWDDPITIDESPSVGYSNDCAIDISGKMWISYYDAVGSNLKVARSKNVDHTEWDIWFVDTEGSVGHYSQIYVDDSNVAHIAYYDATNQKLKYARFNP